MNSCRRQHAIQRIASMNINQPLKYESTSSINMN